MGNRIENIFFSFFVDLEDVVHDPRAGMIVKHGCALPSYSVNEELRNSH